MVRRSVAAIGLDSAEWNLVEQLLADGELPHLAALRERSAFAHLHNPDYRTGLAWEHFVAGKGPAGCGRFAAIEFDPKTYGTWQEGARPLAPFYATQPPARSILFDVPYVSLATSVPGVQVTDWGGHDPGYPPASTQAGLFREIEDRFGRHPASANCYEVVWNQPEAIDALADALVVGAQSRTEICRWLLERDPDWELFMTVFSEPHSVNEALWHGVDDAPLVAAAGTSALAGRRLRDVYRAVDDALGKLIADLPNDTTVVVFSLHGSQRNETDIPSMVLLPELLYRLHTGEQYLHQPDSAAWAAGNHPIVVPDAATSWPDYMLQAVPGERETETALPTWRSRVPEPAKVAYRAARDVARSFTASRGRHDGDGRSTDPVRLGALGRPIPDETTLTPAEVGVLRTSVDWQLATRYRHAWAQMRAFALPTFYDGRIRINLAGRERDGVVALADYERVCSEIEAAVGECRDPRTGEPVLAEVRRLRADDPMEPGGPDADLQLFWTHGTDAWEHPTAGTVGPFPNRRTGGHSERGFASIAGPDIEPGSIGTRSFLDVAPTILALLGRDHAGELEGKSLLD